MKFTARSVSHILIALTFAAALPATALEPARGKVILTVTGEIGEKNAGDAAQFDMEMLEKLPQVTFSTSTPWHKEPVKFTGPYLRDVLAAVKAKGSTLSAVALNDYRTTIPMEDTTQFDVVLAVKMDDEHIPVRTKGPLFIIYPFDKLKELKAPKYFERSAWQLKSIAVK